MKQDTSWLRGWWLFASYMSYILLLLFIKEHSASPLVFLLPVLMPLFVTAVSFVWGFRQKKERLWIVIAVDAVALAIAGLVYLMARLVDHTFLLDGAVVLFDAVLAVCLVLGCLLGIRVRRIVQKHRERKL